MYFHTGPTTSLGSECVCVGGGGGFKGSFNNILKKYFMMCQLSFTLAHLPIYISFKGFRVFAWGGGGGGQKCLATAAASLESRASPEKADERGGGGGGGLRHIFFVRLQKKKIIMG